MKIIELTGTTAADGSLTVSSERVIGFIEKVVYDYVDAATGADLVLTAEDKISEGVLTKANLGVANAVFYPRAIPNKVTDGSAFTDVAEKIFVTGSLKAVIAEGGNAKVVSLFVYLTDE